MKIEITIHPPQRGPLMSAPAGCTVNVHADDEESARRLTLVASTCAEDLVRAVRGEPRRADDVEPEAIVSDDGADAT